MTISSSANSVSTVIVIPGREDQVIPGMTLSKEQVIASFAQSLDLKSMDSSESTVGGVTTVTFSNRTGTKGSDINVSGDLILNVSGDVVVNSTRIVTPGREDQILPGMDLGSAEVIAAFAGVLDLSSMDSTECVEDNERVITFANRTGTKGQVDFEAIARAVEQLLGTQQQQQEDEEYDAEYDEDDFEDSEFDEEPSEVLENTLISIPGRETRIIEGLVMDAQMVKDSYRGTIDLSGYNVEEIDNYETSTLEVRFTARTGTKG